MAKRSDIINISKIFSKGFFTKEVKKRLKKQKEVLVDDIQIAGFREVNDKYHIILYLPYLKKVYYEMIFNIENGALTRVIAYDAYIDQHYKERQSNTKK